MNKLIRISMIVVALAMVAVLVSCSTEAPETQKLYTDAKQMWDDLNNAFTLDKGQERVDKMRKILDEEWDLKIVSNLEAYLKAAPTGKFAADATSLLEQAKNSDRLRNLGQARPLLQKMGGAPKTAAQVDSMAQQSMPQDTAK